MNNIQLGDVVYLKSGSPKLTVHRADSVDAKVTHFDYPNKRIIISDWISKTAFTHTDPNTGTVDA